MRFCNIYCQHLNSRWSFLLTESSLICWKTAVYVLCKIYTCLCLCLCVYIIYICILCAYIVSVINELSYVYGLVQQVGRVIPLCMDGGTDGSWAPEVHQPLYLWLLALLIMRPRHCNGRWGEITQPALQTRQAMSPLGSMHSPSARSG